MKSTFLALILWVGGNLLPGALVPRFTIAPATTVEVGEEVLFNACSTTYENADQLKRARFEWDFGDGYTFKYGSPVASSSYSGIGVTHFFMRPGTFTITLTVSIYNYAADDVAIEPPLAKLSVSHTLTVTGEAPLNGFELLTAPFHNRLAQQVIVRIPVANAANRLLVTLNGSNGYAATLFDKTGLATEESFMFDQRALGAATYTLSAELRNGSGVRQGIWKEKFRKAHTGIPHFGIDENNALCIDGEPFFLVTPWMLDKGNTLFDPKYINSTDVEGYYDAHDLSTWADYLSFGWNKGILAIGPGRGTFNRPLHFARNNDIDQMALYADQAKNHPGMLAHTWFDEPNMGGRHQRTYSPVLAAWQYVGRSGNPAALNTLNLYGYDWLPHYGTQATAFDYLGSADLFGGKKAWFSEFSGFDIYPLEYRLHVSLNKAERGPIDLWVEALEQHQRCNLHLVPNVTFIEVCDVRENETPGPTSQQVLMEAWLAVVHGMKGVQWFNYFVYSSLRYDAMEAFKKASDCYGRVILSADPGITVSDNSNTALNRVDSLTRRGPDGLYIFAVRLTEPEPIASALYRGNEPASLITVFTVPGASTGSVQVLDENGAVVATLPLAGGQFSDTFPRCAVRIYRIPTIGLSITSPNGAEAWRKGEQRAITWTANGVTGNLVIELLQNNAVTGLIASGVSASAGTYAWTVGRLQNNTYVTGSNLKIRIRTPAGSVVAEQNIGRSL